MRTASPKSRTASREVIVRRAELRAHTAAEAARLRALPDGEAGADSPELDEDFFAEAKPTHEAIPGWPVRPPGRPAAGEPAPATAVVSLRLPRSLRTAVQRRAKALHVSFNAAMQMAAATWVGGPEGRGAPPRVVRSR